MKTDRDYYIKKREQALKMFPTMSAPEISTIIGVRRETINRWVKSAGVKHTESTNKRLREKSLKRAIAASKANAKEIAKKVSIARKRLFRIEQFRVLNGTPQKTKLKIRIVSKRTTKAMSAAARNRNYFYESIDDMTLYYDRQTRRDSVFEQRLSERYGIKFEEAAEEPEAVVND